MAPLHRTAVFLWSILCFIAVTAAQREPEHAITYFPNLPSRLFFFDDTTSVLYHDSSKGNVWVSGDEGKNWKEAEGIPDGKAAMLIEHPFDNNYVRSRVMM